MKDCKQKKIEACFHRFVENHFVPPALCKDLGQLKFYIDELYAKIEEASQQFGFVPTAAFVLLSDYDAVHKQMCSRWYQ